MTKFSKSKWTVPTLRKQFQQVGEQIRFARLRRNLSIELVAERAQCSRTTVMKVEKGDPTVSFGVVGRVLFALQMSSDLLLIAGNDHLGQLIQDSELRKRASKK